LQDPWYRLCLGLLGDAEKAREATQETALRVLRDLGKFAGRSQFKTWTFGIALNVVREMRRERFSQGAAALPEPQSRGNVMEAVLQQEQCRRLSELVQDLPARQREALLLRFFEDQSVEQTAAAMHCAVGTIKATVYQALRTLRQRLEQRVMKEPAP
jgi:RNA polymerase sigma-70 factor (ECF subfamily)